MKSRMKIEMLASMACLALAVTAAAQPEEWLQYHISREGKGYRRLNITTNPPPQVALPPLNGKAYFARWDTPLDATGGRWLCLDGKRKSGPRDRLFIDRNGNGRLDDEPPEEAAQRDQSRSLFEPVRMVFKGEDGPVIYHLVLEFRSYSESSTYLMALSGGYYEGMVTLVGKKRRIQLMDGNVNGTFNDVASNPAEADRIMVGDSGPEQRYLGRLLEIDNQWLRLEVARDGAFVKVRPAENLVLGPGRLPPTISQFTAVGENGHFVRKPSQGELSLPIGQYRMYDWKTERKDDKGVMWRLQGSGFSDAANFEVAANAPTSLAVGEPLRAALQVNDTPNQVGFSLRLQGQLGESVEMLRGTDRPRPPKLIVAGRDGAICYTNNFEYG